MELPAFLPLEFKALEQCLSSQELYNQLIKNIPFLIRFLFLALDDEKWSYHHKLFYQLVLGHLTHRFYQDNLAESYAEEIKNLIHHHYAILHPLIPYPLTIEIKDKLIPINPLIVGIQSLFLKNLIFQEGKEKKQTVITLDSSPVVTEIIFTYLETGRLEEIWRFEKEELGLLMQLTEKWKITALFEECQKRLSRYITSDNVFEVLSLAKKKRWQIIFSKSIDQFNQFFPFLHLSSVNLDQLSLQFEQFSNESLTVFYKIAPKVTDLILSKFLVEDVNFLKAIHSCSSLKGLDLSDTQQQSPYFQDLPKKIQHLILDRCAWVNDLFLKNLYEIMPTLTLLSLKQNTQLSYQGLSDLKKLEHLKHLNLAECYQIEDREFQVIIAALPFLESLNISYCRKISELSFFDLGHKLTHLSHLFLEKTAINDKSLIFLTTQCQKLQSLDLSRCRDISTRGIKEALKNSSHLKTFILKENAIDLKSLQMLESNYPKVTFIY